MTATTVEATVASVADPDATNASTGGPGEAVSPGRDSPTSRRLAAQVLLIAGWFGLAGGGLEGLYWTVRQTMFDAMVFLHPGYLWMAPLALTALTLTVGAAVAAGAWLKRTVAVLHFAVTILALVVWLNLLKLFLPGLQFWAWILLACGLAATTGRVFQKYAAWSLKWIRRTTWLLASMFLAIAVSQSWLLWRAEQQAMAAVPEPPADSPNILLIVLDTVRADTLAADQKGSLISPHVAEFARQGVLFEQATATAPWTLPAQAGMFTGRLPHELSADWLSKLGDAHHTLAEELSSRGWANGGFVGNTRYCSKETGLARGFAHYEGYRFTAADLMMSTALGRKLLYGELPLRLGFYDWPGRKRAEEINHRFLTWLERRSPRPYFAFLNYWDAHDPYFPPSGLRAGTSRETLLLFRNWWWVHKENLTSEAAARLGDAYRECVRQQDQRIGALLAELKERGELDNTIVIITADHGEHLGEHDLYLHGNSLYQPLIHVPLVVVWPSKIPANRRIDAPVSLRGLPNTVLDLLAIETNAFPGWSWTSHWSETPSSSAPVAAPVFAEIASQANCPPCHGRSPVAAGPMRSVRLGDFKLIQSGDDEEQLFNLAADPQERNDLSGDSHYHQTLLRLRDALFSSYAASNVADAAHPKSQPNFANATNQDPKTP